MSLREELISSEQEKNELREEIDELKYVLAQISRDCARLESQKIESDKTNVMKVGNLKTALQSSTEQLEKYNQTLAANSQILKDQDAQIDALNHMLRLAEQKYRATTETLRMIDENSFT